MTPPWSSIVNGSRLAALGEEVTHEPLRRGGEPRLRLHLLEQVDLDLGEPDEDDRMPVEVRRREKDARLVAEQGLLGDQVLDLGPENRPVRRRVPERGEIALPQRPLPDEQLLPDGPRPVATVGRASSAWGRARASRPTSGHVAIGLERYCQYFSTPSASRTWAVSGLPPASRRARRWRSRSQQRSSSTRTAARRS